MKILHISTSDFWGGAARAAYRIHHSLLESGVDSRMCVLHRGTSDETVSLCQSRSTSSRLLYKMYHRWLRHTQLGWHTNNPILHTFGQNSAGFIKELNSSDADIINLHWVSDILSVRDIGKIEKPVVWTFHDMWPFCGGEHYAPDNATSRFRQGYHADNRPADESGPDLNRRTWKSKRQLWAKQRFSIICPSHWLANCTMQSVMFVDSDVYVVPYPLDVDSVWRPISQQAARIALGLPPQKKLVLMGADGGISDIRKGGDLLHDAIMKVTSQSDNIELMIYGQTQPKGKSTWNCPVHWLGVVHDDRILSLAYSAADVMVVPSRQDNLPNTAIEAQACGTPVVAFNIGGLPDIITHRKTGWLAKAFNTDDLAEGISWVLSDKDRWWKLSQLAREKAVDRFSPRVIAKQYEMVYDEVLSEKAIISK